MLKTILRKEHKNEWEKRVALVPGAVGRLLEQGYKVDLEQSKERIFSAQQYQAEGAKVVDSLDGYELILGIKEPPVASILKGQTHLCFSHTIKGQKYNMPLLQQFIDQKATLIDYELMTDNQGVRTIAFGRYAGIAGAIDTLWLYAQRQAMKGISTSLSQLKQTWEYRTVELAQKALEELAGNQDQKPLRIIILGNGKVGTGAAEVCHWLGIPVLSAKEVSNGNYHDKESWYSVLDIGEMYCHISDGGFDREEYIKEGKKLYCSRFPELLTHCDVVLNCCYWTDHYPRHMTFEDLKHHAHQLPEILGDISCDIGGSFSCTHRATEIGKPVFTYDPMTGEITDELTVEGLAVMAIDNLPCELSEDASSDFSLALESHLPDLMTIDFANSFEELPLDRELKDAIIVYRGKLTPRFEYLQSFLEA
jgi:alpha-aminoadipic semialdehyde synthase